MSDAIENVMAFAKQYESKPYWRLYYSHEAKPSNQAGEAVAFTQENGSLTPKTSQEALKATLQLMPPGDYKVGFKTEEKDTSGIVWYVFKIPGAIANINGMIQPQQGAYQPPKDMVTMETMRLMMDAGIGKVTAEFEKMILKTELNTLKDEIKGLRKKKDVNWNGLIELGTKGLAFFTGQEGTQVAISGLGGKPILQNQSQQKVAEPVKETEEQETEEDKQAYAAKLLQIHENNIKVLSKLFGGDEEMIITLYCLRRYIEDNPGSMAMLKPNIDKYRSELETDED